jgi:hypothetical protein
VVILFVVLKMSEGSSGSDLAGGKKWRSRLEILLSEAEFLWGVLNLYIDTICRIITSRRSPQVMKSSVIVKDPILVEGAKTNL